MIAPSISSEIIHHRTPRRVKAIVDRILLEAVLRCGHRSGSRLLRRRTLHETTADAGGATGPPGVARRAAPVTVFSSA